MLQKMRGLPPRRREIGSTEWPPLQTMTRNKKVKIVTAMKKYFWIFLFIITYMTFAATVKAVTVNLPVTPPEAVRFKGRCAFRG